MVNYNFENPEERGFWYDCEVSFIFILLVVVDSYVNYIVQVDLQNEDC